VVTDENGGSDTFTVQLDSQPAQHVTLDLVVSDPSEGIIVSINPIFINKNKPFEIHTVTVSGVSDLIEDGNVLYEINGTTSSNDKDFDGLVMPTVYVINYNDPFPVANDDFPVSPDSIPVLDNDAALVNSPFSLSIVSNPSDGNASVNPDNTITYTPLLTFSGSDQFSYQVCDADGDCSSADVFVEDQVPPVIISLSPIAIGETGVMQGEVVTISVEVFDDFWTECVSILRWDPYIEQHIPMGDDCQEPYTMDIENTSLNYGWNQIFIQASDSVGNLSEYVFFWLIRARFTFIPLTITP
jgi:hypothetical protein